MNEVYKVAELYLKIVDVIEGRSVEIHLDLNPDPHLCHKVLFSKQLAI
ncbi:MAG: hypothetical protein CM15mP58_00520 [Burkholderiaceae bacterium]|nr:MAG: hypothetical protein CM15mP58_00520 [Burkholderiaceae bacterium]